MAAAAVLAMPAASAFAAGNAAAGAAVAAKKCAGCHGATGAGNGPELQMLNVTVPPVPWTDKAKMSKFSDAYLTKIVTDGGRAVGKGPLMAPFKGKLTAAQISDAIAYIRSLAK
ncbi:MAG: c-type cytochrome [Bryobacteraceae bacterium]